MIYSIFIPGSVLEFVELKDQEDRTLCEFLAANIGQGGAINSKDGSCFSKEISNRMEWNWNGIEMELKWNWNEIEWNGIEWNGMGMEWNWNGIGMGMEWE